MPLFFIQSRSIRDNEIALSGDLAHHLRDVLRYPPGKIIDLVDENKIRYRASLARLDRTQIRARILKKEETPALTSVAITLAQALLKGKKMDWIIQKATELGVTALVPVVTERTIPRPRSAREPHQILRWRKVAKEAAQQCGRVEIPAVDAPVNLKDWITTPPPGAVKLVLWEQEERRSPKRLLSRWPRPDRVYVLVGPEGGFAPGEIEAARRAGFIPISMGTPTLRSETAALAALAMLQYEWGDPSEGGG